MKKRLNLFLSLLASLLLASCYDLGFEAMEEYYDCFDDTVYLKYVQNDGKTFSSTSAGLEANFLNENTQNNFSEDCLVESEYYTYFAVQLNSDGEMIFDDLCLYISTNEDALMEIRFYVVDSLPSKGRGFNAEATIDGKTYDDKYVNPFATVKSSFSKGVFRDIYVDKWEVNGKTVNYITLKPDQYMLVQFYNNTGYGKDAGYKSVKFTATNFIFSEKGN